MCQNLFDIISATRRVELRRRSTKNVNSGGLTRRTQIIHLNLTHVKIHTYIHVYMYILYAICHKTLIKVSRKIKPSVTLVEEFLPPEI